MSKDNELLDKWIDLEIDERVRMICEAVPLSERLAQAAEEAAELAKAALKLRRALGKDNYTPVSAKEAWQDLMEEAADCELVMKTVGVNKEVVQEVCLRKSARWLKRLKEQKENEFCQENGEKKIKQIQEARGQVRRPGPAGGNKGRVRKLEK